MLCGSISSIPFRRAILLRSACLLSEKVGLCHFPVIGCLKGLKGDGGNKSLVSIGVWRVILPSCDGNASGCAGSDEAGVGSGARIDGGG